MCDDLYNRDILTWSRHRAGLLRRLARGERVNGVDWAHVVEEIEDVGRQELNAVHSYLRQMLVHLLEVQGWPENSAVDHWRAKIGAFRPMRPNVSCHRCGGGSRYRRSGIRRKPS